MKWTLLQPEGDGLKTRKEMACGLDGGQEGKGIHRKKNRKKKERMLSARVHTGQKARKIIPLHPVMPLTEDTSFSYRGHMSGAAS